MKYDWQQAGGLRHIFWVHDIPHVPMDIPFDALCGAQPTPTVNDFTETGGHWFDPTCLPCEEVLLNSPVGVR